MKLVENTSKQRIQVLLDEDTILCLKEESEKIGLGISPLVRTILRNKFNKQRNDKK